MSEFQPNRVISGFRPTSDLTVGNYLGAIRPSLEIQENPDNDLYVFVADMHGLTDHDPREIAPYRSEVVHDCLALGVDPSKTTMYLQSAIEAPVTQIANRLAPYVSVAELARTPNLKEKMQTAVRRGEADSDDALKANFGLLGYPVLMGADIFAQESGLVAVGEDQEPHLELARKIASRFNKRFDADLLVEPRILAVEALRVVGLDGKGKMSKTNPSQAIMLTDDPDHARRKIKKATTAPSGEWNPVLDSHFLVAEHTTRDSGRLAELQELRDAHMLGRPVMGEFKRLWGDITQDLLVDFQAKKNSIAKDEVDKVLEQGATKAAANAERVLRGMKEVMGL
jgi:tryptophanyl-tRNA synthetase